MKKIICLLMAFLPMAMTAQNAWENAEKPKQKKQLVKIKKHNNAPYLRGAVPEVDGRVEWDTTYVAPGKSKQELYTFIYNYFKEQTTEEGQIDKKSMVVIDKPEEGICAARYSEILIFTKSALVLDQTQFNYTMAAKCYDGKIELMIKNLSYDYEEEHTTAHYTAEEWISDDAAVNKKNTKLYPISAKFRRKTVDRMRYTIRQIDKELKEL